MSTSVDQGKQTPGSSSVQRRHLSQSVGGNQSQRIITQPSSFMQSPMHDGATTMNGEGGQISWGTNINTNEIITKFEKFLLEFAQPASLSSNDNAMQDEGAQSAPVVIYVEKLTQMAKTEDYTLTLDGQHLYSFDKILYNQLIFFPAEVIQIFDKVTQTVFRDRFAESEVQVQQASHILVAIVNIRLSSYLRDL